MTDEPRRPGEDTEDLTKRIDWESAAKANWLIENVRAAVGDDVNALLRIIAGLVASEHAQPDWMSLLTREDLQKLMGFGKASARFVTDSVTAEPLVAQIVAAGPVVTRLAFRQLIELYHNPM
ncbi:MAG TPA: hypothetical protein VLA88_04880 [Candidatus Saccharimonadales bacterium]|nr:hypothetical protein [Candidatus Saccharimonadales bacterium]